jgi:hypothetical protein
VFRKSFLVIATVVAVVVIASLAPIQAALGQGGAPAGAGAPQGRGGGGGQGGRGGAAANLPAQPTAVALPAMEKVTGPGAMYDSSPAQWPGRDMAHYKYVKNEYFVFGSANGQPYTTRVVVRQPIDNAKFSGLVVAESMHPIGAAHAFEYNSVYIMDSGHIAVEIATTGAQNFTGFNAERYAKVQLGNGQANEILAQVGALVKSSQGPLAGLTLRKMVLWGTSASSGVLTAYLPAHRVYRTPDMKNIYDGFMPTSNGAAIMPVDVPIIQVPTQHEFRQANEASRTQDSDEPGSQFRVYEFPGMGHLDARNNKPRFTQKDCTNKLTTFPNEAYFSVALNYLLRWVDTGAIPPRADRAYFDYNVAGDNTLLATDEYGNFKGGIRTPYTDLPVAKYTAGNTAVGATADGGGRGGRGAAPANVAPPAGVGARGGGGRGGGGGAFPVATLCNLSVWETPIEAARLKQMYGNKGNYVKKFEQRLNELEKAGWSLPVYHDLLLADAKAVSF